MTDERSNLNTASADSASYPQGESAGHPAEQGAQLQQAAYAQNGTAPGPGQAALPSGGEPNALYGYSPLPAQDESNRGKRNSFLRGMVTGILIALLVFALVWGARGLGSRFFADASGSDSIIDAQTAQKADYIAALIDAYFYQDIEDETLREGVFRGMLEALDDPYSDYYTAEEYEELMADLLGEYSGIGAVLTQDRTTGTVTITEVYPDSPAEKAGLKRGDIILSADDYQAEEYDLDDFVMFIRGQKGTKVRLQILRGEEELSFEPVRDEIVVRSVTSQMAEDGIGYVRISQFVTSTATDFVEAMEELQQEGMEAVIIDLRDNGGGLLESVVSILDWLLPEGVVVYTMDKEGNRQDYVSSDTHSLKIPMVVLVNENTASASEIFTGAIRDYDWGTTLGTTTFGKGIVQTTLLLNDGSALKLTVESYYTPSGEAIHGVGITPDIVLEYEFQGGEEDEYDLTLDNQYQKALELLERAVSGTDAASNAEPRP